MKKHNRRSLERLENRQLLAADLSTLAGGTIVSGYSIDGSGNNLANPDWGSAGSELLRIAPADYADGRSAPAGADRPSPREISNQLSDQAGEDLISDRSLSAMIYAWGQFIDHDLDLTPNDPNYVPFNVQVPAGDPSFDPFNTGTATIPLHRSLFDATTGITDPRQQVNVVTSWLDGSMIYGSDANTAAALRTFAGGKLKASEGEMLPYNSAEYLPDGTLDMANDAHIVPNDQLYAAGDARANENIELTSLQTLFVREHNWWADKIAAKDPSLSDESIYQRARTMVIAEIQSITYNEWLPALLGRNGIDRYSGYDPTVNPNIANEFSTAAFRLGHSMLGDDVEFLDNNGIAIDDEIPLSQAFFNPGVVAEQGIAPILKYLASDPASEVDTKVVESVRNFLFGPPGAGGLDLVSLNIQRGRDHGLADYNSVRVAYGLPAVTSFAEITWDPELQSKLETLYGSVNNIDLWPGALAEDHVRGSSVGPTLQAIISDQFERLRDGDRFWFENTLSGRQLDKVESTTLADIIRRNTDLTNLQDNVFKFKASISGTVFSDSDRDGRLDRGERKLGGQTVQLIDGEGALVATTTTRRDGSFSFAVADGVRTGQYQVSLPASPNSQAAAVTKSLSVTRGDQFLSVNLPVGRRGRTSSSTTSTPTGQLAQLDALAVDAVLTPTSTNIRDRASRRSRG